MIIPPDAQAHAAARARLDALAKPLGALGRLEDLVAWVASCQGACPPRPLERVRAVVLAGDHGIRGVSAYPREVTAAMLATMQSGRAAVNVLAGQYGVALRAVDVAVDTPMSGTDSAACYRVRRASGDITVEDALSADELVAALAVGRRLAAEEIDAGADLLILGDMGIGNTTPAAALVAASFGLPATEVTGRGTGVADDVLADKVAAVQRALDRAGDRVADPYERLRALGSADLAAGTAFLITAAEHGVPVLLDGIVSVAEACVAEDAEPGVIAWCAAGHLSTEPSQRLAVDKLGLIPVLDLGLRLGEGTGALLALPVLRSGIALAREMALLADLG